MEAALIAVAAVELTALLGWCAWVSQKLNSISTQVSANEARIDAIIQDHEERLNELERMFPRSIPHH